MDLFHSQYDTGKNTIKNTSSPKKVNPFMTAVRQSLRSGRIKLK